MMFSPLRFRLAGALRSLFLAIIMVGLPACGQSQAPEESSAPALKRFQEAVAIHRPPVEREKFLYGIFGYPPRYIDNEGTMWPGLVARQIGQFTTQFPDVEGVDGVMLLLYWSVMEPAPGQYRWEIIDQAIDYWSKRNRKVVINVVPWAMPTSFCEEWGGIQDGLPDWLADKGVKIYRAEDITIMGNPLKGRTAPLDVPSITSQPYLDHLSRFIHALGERYDGNPHVAFVRIGTGHMGEETYPINMAHMWGQEVADAVKADGIGLEQWYDFCIWTVRQYQDAFPHTPLSINLILTGYVYKKPEGFMQADRLLNYCLIQGIMMGNNGLRNLTLDDIQKMEQSPRATYWLLKQFSDDGFPVENEVYGPPENDQMSEPDRLIEAVKLVKPRYLNFFGVHLGVIAAYRNPELRETSADWRNFTQIVERRNEDPLALAKRYSDMLKAIQSYRIP